MSLERDTFFKIYHPVHLHFVSDYDAIKYGWKGLPMPKIDDSSMDTRLKMFAGKFNTHKQVLEYCVSNFACGDITWLFGDIAVSDAINKAWKARINNLTQVVEDDYEVLTKLKADTGFSVSDLIRKTNSGKAPPLLQMTIHGNLSREFTVILDKKFSYLQRWYEEDVGNDPFLKREVHRLIKYQPILSLLRKGI